MNIKIHHTCMYIGHLTDFKHHHVNVMHTLHTVQSQFTNIDLTISVILQYKFPHENYTYKHVL